jgi:two-component system OmpR family sensor kinase/two-component system sensor histidine kinase BaeS
MAAMLLVDASGRVIYDGTGTAPGQLQRAVVAGGVPIAVDDQVVGYLAMQGPGGSELSAQARQFLDEVNTALFQAGLIAAALGVIIGIAITRGLTAPLARLAAAARNIANGDLAQRIPEAGPTEVTDVARAFNEMAAGLQQGEQLRRQLVADIAHELRTPLSVLQGNLRAMLDGLYSLDKTEVAALYDETLMLNRLVSDLYELAQAEAGQLQLDLQPIDLAPMIARAATLFTEAATATGVTLELGMPRDLPAVRADGERVAQVLHNLLANALRHTPAGGKIALQATLVHNRAGTVTLPDRSDQVRISVTDSGCGIAADDLPHVFERFWRAERSRSRRHGGAGLGLAIAKQLVEAQGGTIGVASEVGQGSTFWFSLPVADGWPCATEQGGHEAAHAADGEGEAECSPVV